MKSLHKKILLFLFLASGIVGAGFVGSYIYQQQTEFKDIYEFDDERDTAEVLKLFESDREWLLSSPDYSPEFALKYRAPNKDPFYVGQMKIKVLRKSGEFIGFVTYYMLNPTKARLLFLAIKPEHRGKHYGEPLIRYALKDLQKMGAKQVIITTRVANERAQTLYKRVGFTESERDDYYVHLELLYP